MRTNKRTTRKNFFRYNFSAKRYDVCADNYATSKNITRLFEEEESETFCEFHYHYFNEIDDLEIPTLETANEYFDLYKKYQTINAKESFDFHLGNCALCTQNQEVLFLIIFKFCH